MKIGSSFLEYVSSDNTVIQQSNEKVITINFILIQAVFSRSIDKDFTERSHFTITS